MGTDHLEGVAYDNEGITKLLDDSLWKNFKARITHFFNTGLMTSCILMHHGTTMNDKFRNDDPYGSRQAEPEVKEHVRMETVILLRVLNIIMMCLRCSVPWLLIVPHRVGDVPISVLDLPDYDQVRSTAVANKVSIDGRLYEVITAGSVQLSFNKTPSFWGTRVSAIAPRSEHGCAFTS